MSYYELSEFEEKILKIVANKENYHSSIIGRSSLGENMHMETLDARKVAMAIAKSFKPTYHAKKSHFRMGTRRRSRKFRRAS